MKLEFEDSCRALTTCFSGFSFSLRNAIACNVDSLRDEGQNNDVILWRRILKASTLRIFLLDVCASQVDAAG